MALITIAIRALVTVPTTCTWVRRVPLRSGGCSVPYHPPRAQDSADASAQTRQRRRVSADASARAPNGGDHTLGTATGNADHGDPAQNDRHGGDGLRRKPLTRE